MKDNQEKKAWPKQYDIAYSKTVKINCKQLEDESNYKKFKHNEATATVYATVDRQLDNMKFRAEKEKKDGKADSIKRLTKQGPFKFT